MTSTPTTRVTFPGPTARGFLAVLYFVSVKIMFGPCIIDETSGTESTKLSAVSRSLPVSIIRKLHHIPWSRSHRGAVQAHDVFRPSSRTGSVNHIRRAGCALCCRMSLGRSKSGRCTRSRFQRRADYPDQTWSSPPGNLHQSLSKPDAPAGKKDSMQIGCPRFEDP